MEEIFGYAREHGLDWWETSAHQYFFYGFKDLETFEEFKAKFEGRPYEYMRRNGQQWKSEGAIYNYPYKADYIVGKMGDDCQVVTGSTLEGVYQFFLENIPCEDLQDRPKLLEKWQAIARKALEEELQGYALVLYNWEIYESVPLQCFEFSYDTKTNLTGLMVETRQ